MISAISAVGMALAMYLDAKYIKFDVKAKWWVQIIKVVVGFALVAGVRALLKQPLLALTGGHESASAIRYFAMTVVGGILWPIAFKWLSKWGKPRETNK